MSTTITDTVTPRCSWCGAMPARPFSLNTEHATVTPDLCEDCTTECVQAVWRVRHQVVQRQREQRTLAYAAREEVRRG